MIQLQNVSKSYRITQGTYSVLESINLTIDRGQKIGILGRNGAGKSTLIRLISGAELPSKGKISRQMSVSWPLAFGGAFQGSLTGLDNLKFICRVYAVDFKDKVEYVQNFAELGRFFWEPVKTYSSGMMARLAFAISLAIEFDCFLIDEVISVGDARFYEKCQQELFEKRKSKSFVMVSHQANNIKEHCERAYVLDHGKLLSFISVNEAYDFYSQN